jgi:hypothetical protein
MLGSATPCLPVGRSPYGRHRRRQEGLVGVIILAAIIAVAIVALLFVVNARLNRRSPELQDYPRKPDGADDVWFTGGGPGGS